MVLLQYLVQLVILMCTPWSYRPGHLGWCGLCTILWYPGAYPPHRWSSATLTSRCLNLRVFSLQIISLLYQLNLWVVYWLYPSNLTCLISNSLKSQNVYRSWSHVAAQQDQISCNLLFGNLLGNCKTCVELKQESHTQLSSLVNLCFSCAMSLPWTTLVDS